MADNTCPNGEYFSVTMQQCMTESAFSIYLQSLRDRFNQGDGSAAQALKREQVAFGNDELFRNLGDLGNLTAGTPLEKFYTLITGSAVKIIVIIVGLVLVGLAVNAWLNENGGGVKVPVKFK